MQQIVIDQFVDRFEDEGDKYIAAVIICDQLPVRITKVGFDNISMIALEPFVQDLNIVLCVRSSQTSLLTQVFS